jgi:PAS domain-containing protein
MLQRMRVDSIADEATLDTALPGVFEHFPDALILADGEGCITYMNPAAEQMLGLALKKMRGFALDKLLSLQDNVRKPGLPWIASRRTLCRTLPGWSCWRQVTGNALPG